MASISYGEYARRSMPASKLFELLLRIKESVGEETFLDALALIEVAHHPTTTTPEGLVGGGVEGGGDPDVGGGAGVGQSHAG